MGGLDLTSLALPLVEIIILMVINGKDEINLR